MGLLAKFLVKKAGRIHTEAFVSHFTVKKKQFDSFCNYLVNACN